MKEREMVVRACLKISCVTIPRLQPSEPKIPDTTPLDCYTTILQKSRKSDELVGAENWKANLPLRPQVVAKAFVPPTSAVINLQVSALWYFTRRHRTRITPQWKLQSAIL